MTSSSPTRKPAPAVVVDSGAIIAMSRDDSHVAVAIQRARKAGSVFHLPVVVLAETVRGGPRDAAVHRAINAFDGELPLSATMAQRAGRLLGKTESDAGVVDAIVAATAIAMAPSVILTTDPDDMRQLTRDHPDVTVYPLS